MNNPQYTIEIKPFNELTVGELYEVLSLRSEVFVVEQNCVYQDVDGKDPLASHVLIWNGTQLAGYARIFNRGIYFEQAAAIGRVIVAPAHRKFGLGHQLIKQCLEFLDDNQQGSCIEISAQQHLEGFYRQHGFAVNSDPYLEDGIPHLNMIRES